MKELWLIHGAGSTPLSFQWLETQLERKAHIVHVNYDNLRPLGDTIEIFRACANECDEPPLMIGHSLGGVIAAAIAQTVPVEKIVTLATPFGGSFAASIVRWFMPSQLMRDIAHQSPVLTSLHKNPPTVPMLSYVSDSGLYIMGERTDGVVTVKSQMALFGPEYHQVNYNHFEILLANDVACGINDFLFRGENI